MSIALMTEVWRLDLPSVDKLVMLALADWANDDGKCWPSIARIAAKSGCSDRTVQRALREAEKNGHLTRDDKPGKGCLYTLHPRHSVTPDTASPVTKKAKTPDRVSPNTSRTITDKNTKRALPKDWKPEPFGPDSQCRAIVDSWSPKELATQIEHFGAHHRGKGNRFLDWQDGWKTWVLNSRRFAKPESRRPANDGGGSFLASLGSGP